ncbi:MAG: hypothetical protein OEM93_07060 [Rhodospirillales bacterium]|nr:hypothetical protein [Rhodospirillales bacterium]MDH3970362.1 hypothetical protein [Rhodospirillales bacterium]
MSFILAGERDDDVVAAFQNYRQYIEGLKDWFPRGAYELAVSDWYFDFTDHKCPHDAWLEELSIIENSKGERNEIRTSSIRIRLLGAYHDGFIEFHYSKVFQCDLRGHRIDRGHRDWRYDEFRLSESGHLLHEIEWDGFGETGRWLIEADDVEYRWLTGPV